jgi:hypothetical protein
VTVALSATISVEELVTATVAAETPQVDVIGKVTAEAPSMEPSAPITGSVESQTPSAGEEAAEEAADAAAATRTVQTQATPPSDLPVTGTARQHHTAAMFAVVVGVMGALAGWAAWERRGSARQ